MVLECMLQSKHLKKLKKTQPKETHNAGFIINILISENIGKQGSALQVKKRTK